MSSITKFLNRRGFRVFEGNCEALPDQINDLVYLSKKQNINIMEIGFNAGHSADTFLKNNTSLKLTSFDIGSHNYVSVAKEYIDMTYPNRHTLILGNSMLTIPKFIQDNPDIKFDLIFIDGGHDYGIVKSDMENCFHLAHKDTVLAVDDTVFIPGWEQTYTIGPTRIWNEYLEQNKVIETYRKHYGFGRGMVWGKYVM